jgi:hypothetical protein
MYCCVMAMIHCTIFRADQESCEETLRPLMGKSMTDAVEVGMMLALLESLWNYIWFTVDRLHVGIVGVYYIAYGRIKYILYHVLYTYIVKIYRYTCEKNIRWKIHKHIYNLQGQKYSEFVIYRCFCLSDPKICRQRYTTALSIRCSTDWGYQYVFQHKPGMRSRHIFYQMSILCPPVLEENVVPQLLQLSLRNGSKWLLCRHSHETWYVLRVSLLTKRQKSPWTGGPGPVFDLGFTRG